MTLLQNAIYSIEAGIEDYQQHTDKRNISAVRNVFAGILLLFKEKLVRLSPDRDKELLIKRDILPIEGDDGEIIFIGKGEKTADVHAIKEKFQSLKIDVDWQRFSEINKLRNQLEHYYTDKSAENVREILAKSFVIIRDFLDKELGENPSGIIDDECWSYLLELEEVFTSEEAACLESLQKINWKYKTLKEAVGSFRCIHCASSLVKHKETTGLGIKLSCSSCKEDFNAEEAIEACIADHLWAEAHIAGMEDGNGPYNTCPGCDQETYVLEEMACVACEYETEYSECSRCGNGLDLNEQDLNGLCSYCSYVFEKVMKE